MKKAKIKIIHIMPQFTTGGAERMVLHYARLLDKEKFEIAVASTVEDGSLRSLFEQHNVKLFIGSRSKDGGRLGVARRLYSFVKEFKPDIIHTHLFGGDIFGWFFKVVKKVPTRWVSTQHNVEFATSLLRRSIWKRILKRADRIIAVADKVKRYDLKYFGLDETKIQVLKNGIETELLGKIPALKMTSEQWRLGIVGRLNKQKGHIYLLQALVSLQDYQWTLHIFGDGEEKETLMRYAAEQGIAERLVWHGVEGDIFKVYNVVDIIAQPSLWEGLSLVIMEALAAGRFVIASKPAGEELIEDGETGLVVSSAQVDDLSEALRYSFKNPQTIEKMAAQARRNALENFDIAINVKNLERVYDSLI